MYGLYGLIQLHEHHCFLQIQITFGNHLHQNKTGEPPDLCVQKEMDYQVASFPMVKK